MRALDSHRLLLLGAALGAIACSAEHRSRPPPDCSIESRYELLTAPTYNDPSKYFTAPTPGLPDPAVAFTTMARELLDATALCGHTEALLFKTQGNHDWGSVSGTYAMPPPQDDPNAILLTTDDMDASRFEGVSFWAQSFYDRALTILLDDVTTNADAGQCIASEDNDLPPGSPGAFLDKYGQPVPDACSLSFSAQVVPNPWWTFYTIPFSAFTQGGNTPDARLRPDGIDRSTISRFVVRAPRDVVVENWFVNIAWYRKL